MQTMTETMTAIPPPLMRSSSRPQRRHTVSCPMPDWMPRSLVERCGGRVKAIVAFSDAERAVLRKRKSETPSVWTERNRVLPHTASIPGRWQHIFTPYLPSLMDALRFPGVEMGIACKAPQTAVTEAALNMLGHAADHAPGPAMVVYPDKDTAKDIMKDRILPMFEDSKRLKRHLTGAVGDESTIRINLRHMPIFLAFADIFFSFSSSREFKTLYKFSTVKSLSLITIAAPLSKADLALCV